MGGGPMGSLWGSYGAPMGSYGPMVLPPHLYPPISLCPPHPLPMPPPQPEYPFPARPLPSRTPFPISARGPTLARSAPTFAISAPPGPAPRPALTAPAAAMADPKYADLPGIVSAGWGPWGGAGRGVGPAGGVWGLGEYVGAAGLGPNCRVWGAAVGVWGGCEALLWGLWGMGGL